MNATHPHPAASRGHLSGLNVPESDRPFLSQLLQNCPELLSKHGRKINGIVLLMFEECGIRPDESRASLRRLVSNGVLFKEGSKVTFYATMKPTKQPPSETRTCVYCRRRVNGKDVTKDHVIPKSRGGKGGSNVVDCCKRCNSMKGDQTPAEWASMILSYRQANEVVNRLPMRHRIRMVASRLASCSAASFIVAVLAKIGGAK